MWDDPEQPRPPRYYDGSPSPREERAWPAPDMPDDYGLPPDPYGRPSPGHDVYGQGSPGSAYPGGAYPARPPAGAQQPTSRPPVWPSPESVRAQAVPGYGPSYPGDTSSSYRGASPAYGDYPAVAHAPAAPQHAPAAPHVERAARPQSRGRGLSLPHLPIAHVFLAAGLLAMAYAISQPWGVAADGTHVFVQNFTSVRLSQVAGIDTGPLALKAAMAILGAAAVLSAVLVLVNLVVTVLNHVLGVIGLSGCASLAFFPVLWGAATLLFVVLLAAAGFAGLGALSNLPVVQSHGFGVVAVKQNALGFYLWTGGAGAVFIGMLGQLVMRRR